MSVSSSSVKPVCNSSIKINEKTQIFSEKLGSIMKNINSVAIPIITLFVLSNMSLAEAGPLAYSACCISCTALLPPAIPACLNLCLPILFFPSP